MEIEDLSKQQQQEESLPTLIRHISSNDVAGFDSIDSSCVINIDNPLSSPATPQQGNETATIENQSEDPHPISHQRMQSISLPNSPLRHVTESNKMQPFEEIGETIFGNENPLSSAPPKPTGTRTNQVKFLSQPIPIGCPVEEVGNLPNFPHHLKKLKDKRYDSFKTFSGRLERQISHLRGKPRKPPVESTAQNKLEKDALPVDRYYDALEGPELEDLRASEEILLPDDKTWPFLLRFPVASFGICLGVSSQAILWKTLATSASTKFLHVTPIVSLVLWCISVALVVSVFSIYTLKVIFYFEAVRREYYHPIRVNFFFAPWISLLFLAIGVPASITDTLPPALWYVLMFPFLCLELKIYGQWMSGGQRRLSKVANPSNHLSVVGNFVGALLGASMGLKEGPIFFFAVGLAHYTVLFVTLYQRLPTNETLPKELHPVFFLFVAAPSVASMAWAKIQGSFDYGSRIAYFIALFLYFSLAVRINFFRGFKFSLAWWAYTFPMTGAAIATIRYSNAVTNPVTQTLEVVLCLISTLVVTGLLVTTILHAFVLRDLFPNDIAIAISNRKPKHHSHNHHIKWLPHLGSSENSDIEKYLKYATSDCNDLEASISPSTSEDGK